MTFPLGVALSAAPGVISAAADMIRVTKENKTKTKQSSASPETEKPAVPNSLIARQAEAI